MAALRKEVAREKTVNALPRAPGRIRTGMHGFAGRYLTIRSQEQTSAGPHGRRGGSRMRSRAADGTAHTPYGRQRRRGVEDPNRRLCTILFKLTRAII